MIKSPLRYPGGKSRAAENIYKLLPPRLDRLCSPFVGGASVELVCAQQGIEVIAYDAFAPLVHFWQALLNDAPALAQAVKTHYPLPRKQFYNLQQQLETLTNPLDIAAAFYTLNRCSFSGTTLSGGISPGHPRFTLHGINKLSTFKMDRFTVKHADFHDSIPAHRDDFLYLDPPYANKGKLYGKRGDYHVGFDHEGLAALLHKRGNWMLSYNDSKSVRKLYEGCTFLPVKWAYGMTGDRTSNEVLISPYDFIFAL